MSKVWGIPLIAAVTLMSAAACAPINKAPAVYSPQLQPGKSLVELKKEVENGFHAFKWGGQIVQIKGVPTMEFTYRNIKSVHSGDDELSVEVEHEDGRDGRARRTVRLRLLYNDLSQRANVCQPNLDSTELRFAGINGPEHWLMVYRKPVGYAVCDALYNIGIRYKEQQKKEYAAFLEQAARYRSSQVKPSMPEEQRKVIVQANAFSERKEYAKAISLYQKAIMVEPVSYPAAYHNLALLYARQDNPARAIFYMKQYLLLAPEAKDARAAQDKIYEWEALLQEK